MGIRPTPPFSDSRVVARRMLTDEDNPPSWIFTNFGQPGIDKTTYIIERLNPKQRLYLYYKYDLQLSDEKVGKKLGYGFTSQHVSMTLYHIFRFINSHFEVSKIVETRRLPEKLETLLFTNHTTLEEILALPAHEREYYLPAVNDECTPEMKKAALAIFRIIAGELSPDTRDLLEEHGKQINDFEKMTRKEIICVPWLHHSSLEEVLAYLNK